MSRDELLAVVRKKTNEIIPDLDFDRLDPAGSLIEAGVSSLDFVELTLALQQDLKAKLPRTELGKVETLNDLLDVLERAVKLKAAT